MQFKKNILKQMSVALAAACVLSISPVVAMADGDDANGAAVVKDGAGDQNQGGNAANQDQGNQNPPAANNANGGFWSTAKEWCWNKPVSVVSGDWWYNRTLGKWVDCLNPNEPHNHTTRARIVKWTIQGAVAAGLGVVTYKFVNKQAEEAAVKAFEAHPELLNDPMLAHVLEEYAQAWKHANTPAAQTEVIRAAAKELCKNTDFVTKFFSVIGVGSVTPNVAAAA